VRCTKQRIDQTLTRPRTDIPQALLPAHREWSDLFGLEIPAITGHLHSLKQRCTTTRAARDTALTSFDTLLQSFINPQDINSPEYVANYLRSFKVILEASRSVFPPQEAYRAALTTLGLFVTDLIDVLPRKSELWKQMRPDFDDSMARANYAEEGVRKAIRELGKNSCKLERRDALQAYLHLMQERARNWGEEEARFKDWADECIMAML